MSSISKPSARLKRVVFLATFISVALFLITCEKDTDHPLGNSKVVVNEITPAQVLYNMVSLQASIEANGHGSVLNHGFCYSLESNPDKSDSIVNLGELSKEESFSATINNLAPATKYFFRAFADIPSGTIWSKEFSFVTLKTGKPLLVTDSVYSVSVSAASFSGTIVADSGLAITRRGFSWGKNSFPGMLDSISEISGTTNNFTFKLQGLEFATKYYFKAFAENQAGISFGSTLEFETLADIPSVTTGEAHSITQSDAVCAGEVTSDGGAWVAARGICWGMTENPTIFGEHSSEGNGTGQFETALSNLTPSATYYYRAYASNSSGIAYGAQRSFKTSSAPVLPVVNTAAITNITTNYALSGGNVTSDGGLTVTAKGLCWGTKPSPTLKDSFSNDGNGTGSFITNIINLAPGTTYYVRAYATNSLGTAFGNELSFTTETAHTIPTVITTTVTSITSSSAVSGGNVTNTGGDAVTSRGVCWSTSQNPTLTNNHTIDGSGSGSFTSNLNELSPSTTYYVRAYATNAEGTAYGNEYIFQTILPCVDFTVNHIAGNVAPVDKTVSYNVVLTNLSGEYKCWITQNLGADFPATIPQDATEAASGWYWQFNLKQGYKHDGSIRTPNSSWGVINNNSDWLIINDPCVFLLGSSWRIPTYTEISHAYENGSWNNYNNTFNSDLKIHAAGILSINNGSLAFRGSQGYYWCGTQKESGYGWRLILSNESCNMGSNSIQYGFPLRCIRD